MKKTLLAAAFVAAMFMTPFAFADNTATPVAAGSASAATARTEGTSPPRTFAYANELKEVLAKATATGEIVTLSAGCALETHEDGSYTDVSDPAYPKAYGPDNVYIDVAAVPKESLGAAPMSVKRVIELQKSAG